MRKFLNLFVDFAFKYIFGREENKAFLIDFLNSVFENESGFSPIVNLKYRDKEGSRKNEEERCVIYDIHCVTESGKIFIVEMQQASQAYFLDRMVYYGAKSVVDQGRRGRDWRYSYSPVYSIALMNFELPQFRGRFRIDGAICDLASGEIVSDKIRCVLLQLPNFEKRDDEKGCKTPLEQWIYNIINMPHMEGIAFTKERELFARLEKVASYAALGEEERRRYDADLKAYRDMKGQLEYALSTGWQQGMEKGKEEEREKLILSMAAEGLDVDVISKISKLSRDEVKDILMMK